MTEQLPEATLRRRNVLITEVIQGRQSNWKTKHNNKEQDQGKALEQGYLEGDSTNIYSISLTTGLWRNSWSYNSNVTELNSHLSFCLTFSQLLSTIRAENRPSN